MRGTRVRLTVARREDGVPSPAQLMLIQGAHSRVQVDVDGHEYRVGGTRVADGEISSVDGRRPEGRHHSQPGQHATVTSASTGWPGSTMCRYRSSCPPAWCT